MLRSRTSNRGGGRELAQRGRAPSEGTVEPIGKLVRPAGIEPATLSLEVRSSQTLYRKFKPLRVQDEAECDRFIPSHAPPAHYSFTLRDPYASLTRGQRETLGQRAFAQTRPWFHREPAAFRFAYLSGQPADVSVRSSREWTRELLDLWIQRGPTAGVVLAPLPIGQKLSPVPA